MKNKKKIFKHSLYLLSSILIASAIISTAVSCSSQSISSNQSKTAPINIIVNGKKYSNDANINIAYGNNITLTAPILNNSNNNVTYKWYCNGQLLKNVTGNKLVVTWNTTKNNYYLEMIVNGITKKSSTITVTPKFNSSLFSTVIYENNNLISNNVILSSNKTCSLRLQLLYNHEPINLSTANVSWTINNKHSLKTSTSIVTNLSIGKNTISATFTNLPSFYGIKNNTLSTNVLTINYAALEINSNLNENSVAFDGSITLSQNQNSINSFKNIGINQSNIKYQWYEIDGSNNKKLLQDTSFSATFNNLKNNTSYYLIATYSLNKQIYTWKSNVIIVNINPLWSSINAKIVCNNNNTNSLNLNKNSINNQDYQFSISSNNTLINNINATVTYTLKNNSTNKIYYFKKLTSLTSSLSINFNALSDFNPGTYTLTASINILNEKTQTLPTISFEITYNAITISLNTNSNNNIKQLSNSNTYNVNLGSNITLVSNLSNVYVSGDPTYQWEELTSNGSWKNLTSNATNSNLTISDLNSSNPITYRLVETINDLVLYSNPITINPVLSNQASITITSSNENVVGNTLNIYNSNNATLTLTLNLNDLDLSNLKDEKITWFVNGQEEQTNSNKISFEYTYSLRNNTVSASISYLMNEVTKTISTTSDFYVNYYSLNLESTSQTISYGQNAQSDNVSINPSKTHLYQNTSYQWEIDGIIQETVYNSIPTNLPNYVIVQNTVFNLVVTNKDDPSEVTIISNPINISVINNNITAKLTNKYGLNDSIDIYSNVTGSSPSSYQFTLTLNQNNKTYTGSLKNIKISWMLNNEPINTSNINDFTFDLPISKLSSNNNTYILKALIKLPAISSIITASYTINYLQLTISSNTGYDGTLSINESSFGSLINTPYYFWQVEESNNYWTTVSTNTLSSSYVVSNLTSSKTYRVIVANASSLNNSTIQIVSESYQVSYLNVSIDVNNQTVSNNSTYYEEYGSLIVLKANDTNLLNTSNVTYAWYCNDQLIANNSSNTYTYSVNSNTNSYYVITYINNIAQTQSSTIHIIPTYKQNLFSLKFYDNNNLINSAVINDLNNLNTYNLKVALFYENKQFDLSSTNSISWILNDNEEQNTSNTFTPTLVMGKNTINVTVNNLSSAYGIKDDTLSTTLIINYAKLEINNNLSSVSVQYDGSITLSPSTNSINSFNNAAIVSSNIKYQWYEVNDNTKTKLAKDTSSNLILNNLTNNATYYLVALYTLNEEEYSWTSNDVNIIVQNVKNLINPKIVYSSNPNETSLNLDNNLINNNQVYQFYIYSNNNAISDIKGTVTYTLVNNQTHNTITLQDPISSLNEPFSINFKNLSHFSYGTYTLSATITTPSANQTSIAYNTSKVSSLAITYSNIGINVSNNKNILNSSNNIYDVNVGSTLTLSPNITNVNINNSTPSYQWEEYIDGKWTLVSSTNNTNTLTINNINSGSNLTYKLIETINNLTLTSSSIVIVPTIKNEIQGTITSSSNTSNNSLNIYNSNKSNQTLTFNFSNINSNYLTNLNIEWLVNGIKVQSGSSTTFNHTYQIGTNNITINISYTLNGQTVSKVDIASFSINYYGLNISTNSTSLMNNTNANVLEINYTNNNVYPNAIYQWIVNGETLTTTYNTLPKTLPSYNITGSTTFQLVATNSNYQEIKSNILKITLVSSYTSIVQYLQNTIPSSLILPSNHTSTAAQGLDSSNEVRTVQEIKNIIETKLESQIPNGITINQQLYTVSQIMQNLNISLPSNVSYENNLAGILQNVQISYGNTSKIKQETIQQLNEIINSASFENILMQYFNLNPSLLLSWINILGLNNYEINNNINIANFHEYFNITSCNFNNTYGNFLEVVLNIKQPLQLFELNGNGIEQVQATIAPNNTLTVVLPFELSNFSGSISNNETSIISANVWDLVNPNAKNPTFQTYSLSSSDNYNIGWVLSGNTVEASINNNFTYVNFNNVTQSMCNINITSNNTNNALQNFNFAQNINDNGYIVTGFKEATLNDETIAAALSNLLNNNVINLSIEFDLTSEESLLNITNQNQLINAIKSYIQNKINSSYEKGLVVNNVSYPSSYIIKNLTITLPKYTTLNDNEQGILQNVQITYANTYSVSNLNSNNYEISNLCTSSIKLLQDNNNSICSLLNNLIQSNIALMNYSLSPTQSLQSTYKNNFIQAIKTAIMYEVIFNKKTYIANKMQYSVSQIINVVQNLDINLPDDNASLNNNAGTVSNITLSYNGIKINNTYTITNLAKINTSSNTNELSINFNQSSYFISTVNGNNLSNFKITPNISNWQDGSIIKYYITIANENLNDFLIATYKENQPFSFSQSLINAINNNAEFKKNKYLCINLIATVTNKQNITKTCSTTITINDNALFLYAVSNNLQSINLNCYTNQLYSLFFENYLSNSSNKYELVEIFNQIQSTTQITLNNQNAINGVLYNAIANTGTITYYLEEINSNNQVIEVSNDVTINCSKIGGVSLTNPSLNIYTNQINVNLTNTKQLTLNIQNNVANVTYNENDIYYQVAANENVWEPISNPCSLFDVSFKNNQIILSNFKNNISINIQIMNINYNLYSNIVTIQTYDSNTSNALVLNKYESNLISNFYLINNSFKHNSNNVNKIKNYLITNQNIILHFSYFSSNLSNFNLIYKD